ncbi:cytochrome c oxidase accessory protein CcoG [Sulfurimonas sp. C5]|uniref:cytochrome c oxidase accessory protein CcoG n=1 Tax=Sulfurimonas sp. C5 TaxID=3036947 RepID=UPI002458305F|nr:cytochrome c oxidase accessory protein CcoG [Sulfurimonas sp. C5]MDH4945433.1 cytochrome c oxidase accessory protein CcoG [Sulfurimonas sp. C5]
MSAAESVKKDFVIPSPWRFKRYYMYVFATIVSIVVPWIEINGNHLFLLSFDKMKLHLAFIQFDMQELYLMPFLLMLLFIGIFGITVVGGRVFCGWLCPQTIFRVVYRDLIETKLLGLRKRIANKQQEPDMSKPENKVKKVLAVLIWSVLALLAGADFMWYFVPPQDFFTYLDNPADHMVMIGFVVAVAVFLIYDIVFLKENFCVYVCPYSRIQSVLYDEHTVMALYDEYRGGTIYDQEGHKGFTKQKDLLAVNETAECTTCEKCVTVCPTHIDIRKGLQLECINCLECVDACTTVMGKLGKPSLVTWSSDYEIVDRKGKTQFFRPKVLAYGAILVIITIILGLMGTTKEHMLLNINKETQAYSIEKKAGEVRVDNAYTFLIQNTQQDSMKYYFDVVMPEGFKGKIEVVRPTKPFTVVPEKIKKKIVILRTTDNLAQHETQDTIIPIKIHAYALGTDGKPSQKISVFRNSTFIYPSQRQVK